MSSSRRLRVSKARRSASMSSVGAAPTHTPNLKSCLSHESKVEKAESAPLARSRRVSFTKVEIREYERVMTDHPSALGGPALGIGWKYEPVAALEMSQYEQQAPPRRGADEFRMPPDVRMSILKEKKVSEASMNMAVRKSDLIQRQRRATIASMEMEPAQVAIGSAVRKFKRLVKMAPTTKREQELLWKNAQEYKLEGNQERTMKSDSGNLKKPAKAEDVAQRVEISEELLTKPDSTSSADPLPDAITLNSDSTVDEGDEIDDDDC